MKMLNKKLSKFFFLIILAVSFSCDDVLSEIPDNRTTIDSEEKVAELLVAAYPQAAYVSFTQPMSDNAADKGPDAIINPRINEEMYFWRDINDTDSDTPTNYWNEAYKAIAQANQALESLEGLPDTGNKSALRGEALICRAYAHFMLVNIFAKAYDPNTASTDLGIPYVTEPEETLLPAYSRASVQEVYDLIEQDIVNGLPLIEDIYDEPAYHFTRKAANAFAAKFYLNIAEWQKVIDHSSLALGASGANGLRVINTDDYLAQTYDELSIGYFSSTEPANLLLVAGNSTYARDFALLRYNLSPGLTNVIFGGNNGTNSTWAYRVFGTDIANNVPKYEEYFRVTNQAAGTGFAFTTFVLLSTDEVLLNRAEAYAMLGMKDEALADINLSYSVKTDDYGPSNVLSQSDLETRFAIDDPNIYTPYYSIPSDVLPYINAILYMKRAMFHDEGVRWFDVKRHHIEVVHFDFSGNSYTLGKNDLRRAIQIPTDAQSFGIEANPR
ncbi:RagB/SusD family nutrient uptake outer membrane protein [Winogradskyella schleiferi]|uniref:RagB/SusD family nutrient uptake outer membrane protein n=1 Tax=Winogradskyella schleiferi TaxID=2686078 RepID=UPI0015C0686E|nr:RagB/SusD family nutrient uptake outer membrane protein [Winogradskyella schleiferi]